MNSGAPSSDSSRPPILARLHNAPAAQGLTIPFITLRHSGGRAPLWGAIDPVRLHAVQAFELCQICGQSFGEKVVVMLRPQDWLRGLAPEPGMHPECAHYAHRGCPVLSGRMSHHRPAATSARMTRCEDPDCDCGIWAPPAVGSNEDIRAGKPIDAWYAVWLAREDYEIVQPSPDDDSLATAGAKMRGVRMLAIRKVRNATADPDTDLDPDTPTALDLLATYLAFDRFAQRAQPSPNHDPNTAVQEGLS